MVGTIVRQEMLLGGRRFRLHVLRWVYAGWLILQVGWLFWVFTTEEFQLAMIRLQAGGSEMATHASAPEIVGARFAALFAWQQAVLLFLITPVVAGSALVDEKREGTLQYLLLTEVETRHLVLGKFVGRVLQVLLLLTAGLPLFALLAGFGSVAPVTVLFFFASQLLPICAITALTLLVSVWCRQVSEVVGGVVALVLVGAGLKLAVGGPFELLDPLWVLEPAWGPIGGIDMAMSLKRLGLAAALWGGMTVFCLALASAALRRVYLRDLSRERGGMALAATRPAVEPIDDDPVEWRERALEGLFPAWVQGLLATPALLYVVCVLLGIGLAVLLTRLNVLTTVPGRLAVALAPLPLALWGQFGRTRRWVSLLGVAFLSAVSSLCILLFSLAAGATPARLVEALLQLNLREVSAMLPNASLGFLSQGVAVTFLASLLVGVRCACTITREREERSWEALLLTPLSAKKIVHGKLWGIIGSSYGYLLAYAGPALCLSVLAGPLALIYTLTWLAVTVLAMYFLGATGLYCSVNSATSWGSLLKTLGIGYVGSLVVSVLCTPGFVVIIIMLLLVMFFIDLALGTNLSRYKVSFANPTFLRVFWLSLAIGFAVLFWLLAKWFLFKAHRRVADWERTRHWEEMPVYRRSRVVRVGR